MKTALDLTADILDVREIIERIEELETERDACTMLREDGEEEADPQGWADQNKDDAEELAALLSLMEDMRGYGGDEKWRGDWYPITLIRDSYFKDYAQELADDVGAIPNNAQWPLTCIDWEQAARELKYDYNGVDVYGVTYWYR